jgi:ABC-type nickel/cobalt efflux system permease component RcnA
MIRFLLLILILLSLLFSMEEALAHPMGNFSINHFSGLSIGPGKIDIRYLLDFAEIPTFQEIQEIDRDGDGARSRSEEEAYLLKKADLLASNLILTVGGETLRLVPVSHEIAFPPGAGGLPTMRLFILYRAALPPPVAAQPVDLFYRDGNYPSRAGWKEMSAAGRGGISLIGSPLPTQGNELKSYPEGEIQSPPQTVESRFSFVLGPASPAASPQAAALIENPPLRDDRFTALMTGAPPTGPMLLFSLAVSFGLGALHALSPGHGKTIVAAYLIGARGTARHALLLGAIVTASHTAGVFLLGIVTLYLSKYIVPERLYPWLGLLSGLSIVVIGLSLFRQRWRGVRHGHVNHGGQGHTHHHPHEHHDHFHHPGEEGAADAPALSGLLSLGVTGGIVPCPSALVVLLSAVAFHQVAFGMLLIVAFSAGLATTLVAIGLLMIYLGGIVRRFERFGTFSRLLPVFSAAGVVLLGGAIAIGSWIR